MKHLPFLTLLQLEIWKHKTKFSIDQLRELFTLLSGEKYIVLPLNEFRQLHDNNRVVIGLRSDIDIDPFKALALAKLESEYNIRSTFCILSTARYAGRITRKGLKRNNLDSVYRQIYELGHEIAIHNDLLTVMIKYGLDPAVFNQKELNYFRRLKIPIYGTSAHGSEIAKVTRQNYEIFSDFATEKMVNFKGNLYKIGRYSLQEFGYQYESYHLDYDQYYSDASGVWNLPGGFSELICRLKTAEKGQRIQILIHPEWWCLK